MGEEKLLALLQESLHLARSGAAKPADFTRVIVRLPDRGEALAACA
jgi:hypothetical protein